jgi:hypothetical protein
MARIENYDDILYVVAHFASNCTHDGHPSPTWHLNQSPQANTLYNRAGCIDEDIGAGGSCHFLFTIIVVLFVPSSRRNFKFLRAKREAQEVFDDEINY